jgi:ABC-type polysaccharide/polyol phosphate export permease
MERVNVNITSVDFDKSIPILPQQSQWRLAISDLREAFFAWRIWLLLGWQDIRLRYRRSSLGPFWLTISMGISIYTMGFLYGHLFKVNLQEYYPFLAAGMLIWSLINLLIIDGTNAFIESENYLKQMKLPYAIFILRVVWRSIIIFLHNIIVIIPIIFFFHVHMSLNILLVLPALLLIAINGFFYGIVLAICGARYRDVTQIITSLMQVAFFLTPIMWNKTILPPRYQYLCEFNPFSHFLELLRAPLIGKLPTELSVVVVLAITVMGLIMALYLLARTRRRIIYWL